MNIKSFYQNDRNGTNGLNYHNTLFILLFIILSIPALAFLYEFISGIIISAESIIPLLDSIDRKTMLVLNFEGTPSLDAFWFKYSEKTTWLPLIITATVSLISAHPGTTRTKILFIAAVALTIIITDQICAGILKPLIGRLRPSHDPHICFLLHYVNGYRGGLHGFVSNHAAINTAIATMLCCVYKDRFSRATFILFATLMCYSRIYLGVHYPGDILAGCAVGWVIAYTTFHKFGRNIHVYATEDQPYVLLLVFYATLSFLVLQ